MADFLFEVKNQSSDCLARTGIIKTSKGDIETPYFIPVATAATVKSLTSEDLEKLEVQCTLANTYHLHLSPGDEKVKSLGGLHKFMNFNKPIFTDSGGFQAFSLGLGKEHNINKLGSIFPENKSSTTKSTKLAHVSDKGVKFYSHTNGEKKFINPEISMKIQSNLGSDIIMAFDECTSPLSDKKYTKKALERTHRWAIECIKHKDPRQALYGIIQGGEYKDLRDESTDFITALPFEGIAIGGSLGKSKKDMHQILDWVIPNLDSRPRHLLGIGGIDDIFECVARGIDTFDCVAPTRIARRGHLFISPESSGSQKNKFRINIRSSKFSLDENPIDTNCTCSTCKNHTRAYLNHLYRTNELTYFKLATLHNVHFMLNLMEKIRNSINNDSFLELKNKWLQQ
ncbi:MAG: tRNA guanosine(34) transglycosylase Tgt [Nanoarchaeota archaeon]|nr:tRNA guanosine(34) transglycosylase Tgt [Nanoarchaeota archaeon]